MTCRFVVGFVAALVLAGMPVQAQEQMKAKTQTKSPAVKAKSAGKSPVEMTRILRVLQDRIVHGDRNAHGLQRKVISRIGRAFDAAPKATWDDPRNARAVVIYTLSGGDPRVLRRLLRKTKLASLDQKLVTASLAYAEGHRDVAARLLAKFDPRSVPASLGGQFSLVKALLLEKKNPGLAIKFLDLARLLMPGTLVEEAALRLQVFLVAEMGELDTFERLAAQYFRRFGRSLYSGSFRRRFATEITRYNYDKDPKRFANLKVILERLRGVERMAVYVEIAQRALSAGQVELSKFAATSTLELAKSGSGTQTRARMYLIGGQLVSDDYAAATAKLELIDPKRLARRDRELLKAIKMVAREISYSPKPADIPPKVVAARDAEPKPRLPLIERADALLAEVDQLMMDAKS